jgi:hypothetical protein
MVRADFAAALDKREHSFLANAARALVLPLAGMLVFLFAADEGFVNLNNFAVAAEHFGIGVAQ